MLFDDSQNGKRPMRHNFTLCLSNPKFEQRLILYMLKIMSSLQTALSRLGLIVRFWNAIEFHQYYEFHSRFFAAFTQHLSVPNREGERVGKRDRK
jgi:hypothetical protein